MVMYPYVRKLHCYIATVNIPDDNRRTQSQGNASHNKSKGRSEGIEVDKERL